MLSAGLSLPGKFNSRKSRMNNFHKTRDIIREGLRYIRGETLDLGAGTAKYKSMISAKSKRYRAFDAKPGPAVDVVGDIESTPFSDNEFDTVISTQVLEHTRHPWLVAKEIFRITKPGGHTIITAPFMVGYHLDPEDNFRFTKDGLALLFREAGFEIIKADFYGKFWAMLSELIHFHFFYPYEPHNRFINKLMSWLERIFLKLDKFSKAKHIFANVFVIAKKPLNV